ncbi:MAG TPA: YeeE/YedE thiosulfate transporter family protein [Nevskiaceae bacterium]|nr:YeeE/YedE thiosulfate transporter family protein [Nevskiaceae bacterium]
MSVLIQPELWAQAAVGGLLIGAAATLLLLGLGRVAGISGILGGLLASVRDRAVPAAADRAWRWWFLGGLLAGSALAGLLIGETSRSPTVGWGPLLLAGVLVGYGTRLGSGCTSGHGVCGLARFSTRSLVATLVFMAAGMATVFLTRHLLGGS